MVCNFQCVVWRITFVKFMRTSHYTCMSSLNLLTCYRILVWWTSNVAFVTPAARVHIEDREEASMRGNTGRWTQIGLFPTQLWWTQRFPSKNSAHTGKKSNNAKIAAGGTTPPTSASTCGYIGCVEVSRRIKEWEKRSALSMLVSRCRLVRMPLRST